MFESLSERLGGVFDRLRGRGRSSEADVDRRLREVRIALLDADVALPGCQGFRCQGARARGRRRRCSVRSRPASRSSRSSMTALSTCSAARGESL